MSITDERKTKKEDPVKETYSKLRCIDDFMGWLKTAYAIGSDPVYRASIYASVRVQLDELDKYMKKNKVSSNHFIEDSLDSHERHLKAFREPYKRQHSGSPRSNFHLNEYNVSRG